MFKKLKTFLGIEKRQSNNYNPKIHFIPTNMYFENEKEKLLFDIYRTVGKHFAKINFYHTKNDDIVSNSKINELLNKRPNSFLSTYDFLFNIGYQYLKYSNVYIIIHRNKLNGEPISLEIMDSATFNIIEYNKINDKIRVKVKYILNKQEEKIYLNYKDIIHLRYNSYNAFYQDDIDYYFSTCDDLINIYKKNLEFEKNKIMLSGIFKIGDDFKTSNIKDAMRSSLGEKEKERQSQILFDRYKKVDNGGFMVIDSNENFQDGFGNNDDKTFQTIRSVHELITNYFGILSAVVDGTANLEEMNIFYQNIIIPLAINFISEATYKLFNEDEIKNNKIEYNLNPFDYISKDKLLDQMYKGALFLTINEIRKLAFGLPGVENGDILIQNKNFEYNLDSKNEKVGEDKNNE